MQFGLLYEIEVPRPWTDTSVSDCFWEALELGGMLTHDGYTWGGVPADAGTTTARCPDVSGGRDGIVIG
jgi:hypothetical protein